MECFDLFKSDPAYIRIPRSFTANPGHSYINFVRTCTCMELGSEARSGFVGANRYHTVVENTLSRYLSLPLATVGTRVLSMYCVLYPISEVFLHCTC